MSEQITEAVKEASKAVKDTISFRFGGAFSAYVATTWVGFNWSNIALLFMSSATVEQRIQAIYGQDHLYWNYLIQPIIVGFCLSIAIPALNAFVSTLTSKFSALSDTSLERARVDVDTKISIRRREKADADAQIGVIKTHRERLESEVSSLEGRFKELEKALRMSQCGIMALTLRSIKITNEINGLDLDLANNLSVSAKQLKELFTEEERIAANEWRQNVADGFGYRAADDLVKGDPKRLLVGSDLVNQVVEDIRKQAIIDYNTKK